MLQTFNKSEPIDDDGHENRNEFNPLSYDPNQGLDGRERSLIIGKNSQGIKITVVNPQTRDDTFKKYTIYTLNGEDKEGGFNVQRRYSDFLLVRKWLVTGWPGCFIPPIPPKKPVGNMNPDFIEERRRFLERFCEQVANLPYLYYSEEFQTFLRSQQRDLEKGHPNFLQVNYDQLIQKYTETFGSLSGKQINSETVSKIGEFERFLLAVKESFKTYKETAKRFASAKRCFYDQFHLFNNYFLSDYEKRVFSGYTDKDDTKMVITNPENSKMAESTVQIKAVTGRRSVENIYEWIRHESREIEAMIEAIGGKDKYHQLKIKAEEQQKSETDELEKVQTGKTTLRTIFSKGSRDELSSNIERNISRCKNNIENLNMMQDIISLVLAYYEIDKFKHEKIERYYDILKRTALVELDNLREVTNYWGLVLQDQKIQNIVIPDEQQQQK